ncbi:MAG: hypothetical protein WCB68_24045, partial [Pyrinomonadaceae bacterium]
MKILLTSLLNVMSAVWFKLPPSYQKTLLGKSGTTKKILSMTSYNFGEVVLVPFPFTDQRGAKK